MKAALAAGGTYCQSFNADILREPWEMLDAHGKVSTARVPSQVESGRALVWAYARADHGALCLGSATRGGGPQ